MRAKLFRPHQHVSNSASFIISILLLSLFIPRHNAKNDAKMYEACNKTIAYACGQHIREEIGFPFWGDGIRDQDCGLEGYELMCEESGLVVDTGSSIKYHVVEINPSANVIQLNWSYNPLDLICNSSSNSSPDTVLNQYLYEYRQNTEDLYLYHHCGDGIQKPTPVDYNFTCQNEDKDRVYFFRQNSLPQAEKYGSSCSYTTLPVNKTLLEEFLRNPQQQRLQELFRFEVYYNKPNEKACADCMSDGGLCWSRTNSDSNDPCLYPRSGNNKNSRLKLAIASGVGGCSIFLLVILIICRCWTRAKYGSSMFSQDSSSYPKDVEAFIKKYGSSIPKRFRYSTLKKITNSFKDELGKGGYGNVYKGTLADGRVVAVKVLKSTKGNGEEFMNEVASIGRTSHVNVVTLLGFCYEGKRRALIYEFMPNGSLEKFIYGKTPSLEGQHLGWEKLYSIAVGIARGLEYLHRGCNTRILHFDIKPHNILLDENFRPKISDFGLAKLYNTDESIISSLLQARGTIGYIAPEVASGNFRQVSHKSDVYSYGMMTLEMVGGRKNVNAGADHTSEIYYPRWLYKRIQSDDVLNLASEISAKENELVRKMVIVGLWCIQTYPTQRPSISKVIEMLEGQTAALEIPPHPYLCSVPSSPSNSPKKMVFSSSSGTEPTSST